MLFTIIIFIEIFCFAFAIIYLRKSEAWWKAFIVFLALTVSVEITGYILYFVKGQSNHWVFNLYLPIEVGFLFYIIYHFSQRFFQARWPFIVAFLIFASVYVWESDHSKWQEYSGTANTIASLFIIVFACLFYYFLLKRDEYIELSRYAAFWIISGLFIFYLGAVALNLFAVPLTELYKKTHIPIRYIIMLVLNAILYGCWAYGFICNYRHQISSQSSVL